MTEKLTVEFSDREVAGIQAAMDDANANMPAEVVDPNDPEAMIPNPAIYPDWQSYMTMRNHDVAGSYVTQWHPLLDDVLGKLPAMDRATVEAALAAKV